MGDTIGPLTKKGKDVEESFPQTLIYRLVIQTIPTPKEKAQENIIVMTAPWEDD